jgi:hypothetical protein
LESRATFYNSAAMTEPCELTAVAYHEAGHAVLAMALGRPIQKVSVAPNDLRLGHCEFKKGLIRPSHDYVETQILIFFGGLAAEARFRGTYEWDGAAQDLRGIRELTKRRAGGEKQIARLERRMLDKAEYLLGQPELWLAVERIASELVAKTTISGRAAEHLFRHAAVDAEKQGLTR